MGHSNEARKDSCPPEVSRLAGQTDPKAKLIRNRFVGRYHEGQIRIQRACMILECSGRPGREPRWRMKLECRQKGRRAR